MGYLDYSEKYVAFLDILGFADFISKVESGEDIDKIFFILDSARFAPEHSIDYPADEFKVSAFSDNVVASAPLTPRGLESIIHYSFQFSWHLLISNGFLSRGAIVKGLVFHEKQVVFGRGLVKAYQMETKNADVPRVIISTDVMSDMRHFKTQSTYLEEFLNHIIPGKDGPYFINTFTPILKRLSTWSLKKPSDFDLLVSPEEDEDYRQTHREIVRERLVQRLEESRDEPRKFRKVKWLVSLFNFEVGQQNNLIIKI